MGAGADILNGGVEGGFWARLLSTEKTIHGSRFASLSTKSGCGAAKVKEYESIMEYRL